MEPSSALTGRTFGNSSQIVTGRTLGLGSRKSSQRQEVSMPVSQEQSSEEIPIPESSSAAPQPATPQTPLECQNTEDNLIGSGILQSDEKMLQQ
jgi:hypothetical protein